mgnify:CR=1 FL=1
MPSFNFGNAFLVIMRMILGGFTHERGMHCDTTSLRSVFAHSGHKFSEATLFGMGEGLGFYYWSGKNLRQPLVGGRVKVLGLDTRLCENLGVDVLTHESASPKRAYGSMKAMLESDKPVMMHVDTYFLDYLNSMDHFGAHCIVAAGLDDVDDIVYVADRINDGLVEVPVSQLIDARASMHRPFPPHNRWFEFKFPDVITIDEPSIMGAIGRNSMEMINSTIKNVGIGGIYYFAHKIRSWKEAYGENQLGQVCHDAARSIEPYGPGSAMFRGLYADFLEHAYCITGRDALKEASYDYRAIASRWSIVARMLREVSCGCTSLTEISDAVREIANVERRVQMDLLCAANLCCRRKTIS